MHFHVILLRQTSFDWDPNRIFLLSLLNDFKQVLKEKNKAGVYSISDLSDAESESYEENTRSQRNVNLPAKLNMIVLCMKLV